MSFHPRRAECGYPIRKSDRRIVGMRGKDSEEIYVMSLATFIPAQKAQRAIIRALGVIFIMLSLTITIAPANAQNTFSATGSMTIPRLVVNGKAAVAALANGEVFVAGSSGTGTAEIYSSSTGTFSSAEMGQPYESATLMQDGRVLLACSGMDNGSGTSPAAIFNPQNGTFTQTGDMPAVVSACTGTLLVGGKVLIAGGVDASGAPSSAAEIYDPSSGAFSATGSLVEGRYGHTATLLNGGAVLIAGGTRYNSGFGPALSSAELYDPSSGQFSLTGRMGNSRAYAAATLLQDGRVLITGGEATFNDNPTHPVEFWNTAEIYDPESGTFSSASTMTSTRTRHSATLLSNGQVLIAGGLNSIISANATASAEIYDPASNSFTATGNMGTGRSFQAAVALGNGQVLVAGGLNGSSVLSSAELYTSASAPQASNDSSPNKRALMQTPSRLATSLPDRLVEQTRSPKDSDDIKLTGFILPSPPELP